MKKQYILLFIYLILILKVGNSANLSTPEKTFKTAINAIINFDASMWYTCLSKIDRQNIKEQLKNLELKKEVEDSKKYQEEENNRKIGKSIEEFAPFNSFIIEGLDHDKDHNYYLADIAELAFIKQINIWKNKYAEIVFIFPVDYNLSPLRISLVNENDVWKICWDLSSKVFVGFNYNDTQEIAIRDNISRYLLENYKIKVSFNDTAFCIIKKNFQITPTMSDKYFRYYENYEKQEEYREYNKDKFLIFWNATGDKKAKEIFDKRKLIQTWLSEEETEFQKNLDYLIMPIVDKNILNE